MDFIDGFHYESKRVKGQAMYACQIELCRAMFKKPCKVEAHITSHSHDLLVEKKENPNFWMKGKVKDL